MDKKLVSIIMPVFNAEQYLKESIDSILNQTYQNFELLVIDDRSTDNTMNILNEYIGKDNRIKVIQEAHHRGIAAALNVGIDIAKGEYIARMDADDIALKDRIARQVTFMNQNIDVGICSTQLQLLYEDGTITHRSEYPLDSQKIKARFLIENAIAHPTVMFRTNTIKHRWKYNTMPSEDYDLWTRMAASEKFACIPDSLLYYRMHEKNTSKIVVCQALMKANNLIVKNYIEKLFHINVSKYRQDDFYICLDKPLDEPVWEYLFRQYQLLKELLTANQEMNIFDESIMSETLGERWRIVLRKFEFDPKVVGVEFNWNFDVLYKKTDLSVKQELKDLYKKICVLLSDSKKIAIYGLGEYGVRMLVDWKYAESTNKTKWKLEVLIDKKKESVKIDEDIFLIKNPSVLLETEYDLILVSSKKYYNEIKNELLMMGIDEAKILYGGRMFNTL